MLVLQTKTMEETLPPQIKVVETPNGVLVRLPKRPWGFYKLGGALFILFGLVFIGFPAVVLFLASRDAASWEDFGILAGVLGLFMLAGVIPILIGLSALVGRTDIGIDGDNLVTAERIGSLRWRRRVPLERLRYLQVASGNAQIDGQPVVSNPFGKTAALAAALTQGRSRALVMGYPKEWLEAVSKFLAGKIEAVRHKKLAVFESGYGEVRPLTEADASTPPPGTQIRLEEWPGGARFTVPPRGLGKGKGKFFGFSIAWLLFMALFTPAMILLPNESGKEPPALLLYGLLSVFWAVGVGMLLYAIHRGRLRAMVQADAGGFRAALISPFRRKVISIPRDEIRAVRVGPSGIEVNDTPILELKVVRTNGEETGLLSNLSDDELHWMSAVIRKALGL